MYEPNPLRRAADENLPVGQDCILSGTGYKPRRCVVNTVFSTARLFRRSIRLISELGQNGTLRASQRKRMNGRLAAKHLATLSG